MPSQLRAAILGFILPMLPLMYSPLHAQELQAGDQQAVDAVKGRTCLIKGKLIPSKDDSTVVVETEASTAQKLASRDVTAVPCADVSFTSGTENRELCEIAAGADTQVNALYKRLYSMTVAELCRSSSRIGVITAK